MKKLIIIIALILTGFFLTACGDIPAPATPMAIVANTVDFSCLSVDNDTVCSGIQDDMGIWMSGPVARSGDPMPVDYLNLEVSNNMAVNTTVFVYSLITITGCGDNPIAFFAVELAPGDSAQFHYQLWNYRCGALGYQETEIFLYNAAGFDPATYPNPWTYPRTDLITSAVVSWENRLPGDMP